MWGYWYLGAGNSVLVKQMVAWQAEGLAQVFDIK